MDNYTGTTLSRFHPLSLLVVIFPTILGRLTVTIITHITPSFSTHSLVGFMVYVACLWIVVALGWVFLRSQGVPCRALGFTYFRWVDLLWAGVATMAGMVLFIISNIIADWFGLPPYQGIIYQTDQFANIAIVVLVCVLIGPLGEEILYRGFLLSWLWGRLKNPWAAGLLATIIFAVVHIPGFGLRGALYILLWTPLIAALFINRRCIYPCFEAHLVNNMFAYVLIPRMGF
jgi:membrane protease YdiL (CAAX protease family)